jgi:hypothetical protein
MKLWQVYALIGIVAYVALSMLVGISTFVPFSLAHRQRILDSRTVS